MVSPASSWSCSQGTLVGGTPSEGTGHYVCPIHGDIGSNHINPWHYGNTPAVYASGWTTQENPNGWTGQIGYARTCGHTHGEVTDMHLHYN